MISDFLSSLGRLWCRFAHPAPMWPVNGYYLCRTCLRKYPVLWEPRHAALLARKDRLWDRRHTQPLPAFMEPIAPPAQS